MRFLTRHEITNMFSDYEECNPVEDYIIKGINIWPILRINHALKLENTKETNNNSFFSKNFKIYRSAVYPFVYWTYSKLLDSRNNCPPSPGKRDIVLLFNHNRK